MCIWQTPLSIDEQVAFNLGDADWADNAPPSNEGCYRKRNAERERPERNEPEPQIDKFKNVPLPRTLRLKH